MNLFYASLYGYAMRRYKVWRGCGKVVSNLALIDLYNLHCLKLDAIEVEFICI